MSTEMNQPNKSGHLDGIAEMVLILDGKPYKTEKFSEDVAFEWSGD